MHIRCPHCNNPIELLDDASLSDISCPSCGSAFSIISDDETRLEASSGDPIGHFTIQAKLGRGGFGTVWKANDTELDRTVAIKVFFGSVERNSFTLGRVESYLFSRKKTSR